MSRRQATQGLGAQTWHVLLQRDEISIETLYETVIVQLATLSYHDLVDKLEANGEDIPDAPNTAEPAEMFQAALQGVKPPWWPQNLDRVNVQVRVWPDDAQPGQYGPTAHTPNNKDLGKSGFVALVTSLCNSIGTPFQGTVEIQITRKKDRSWLGAWKGEVSVGTGKKNSSGGPGGKNEEWDAITEHALKQADKKDEAMLRMFNQSSSVITASAAAINAMRGINMAPPWMQGQGEEEDQSPFWMHLAGEATKILLGSGVMTGGNPQIGQAAGQMMNIPVQRGPRALQQMGNPQIPMQRGGHQPDYGYDNYIEEDDDEGYYADDEDIIDEEWDEDDYDDDGYDDNEEYEDEYEEAPRNGGNPLAGMSPGEVAQHMDQWLDEGHDKGQVKQLGMKLATKIL